MKPDLQELFVEVWETVERGEIPEEMTGRGLNLAVAVEMLRKPGYDPENDLRVRYLRAVNQDRMAARFTTKCGMHAGLGFLTGRFGFQESVEAAAAAGW